MSFLPDAVRLLLDWYSDSKIKEQFSQPINITEKIVEVSRRPLTEEERKEALKLAQKKK